MLLVLEVRVERPERVRLAAARRVAGGRDRARELRRLELVREEPRRPVQPGLDAVDEAEPGEDGEDGKRRAPPLEPRPCGRGDRDRRHSAVAPRTTRGSRSVWRRTNRHDTPACAHP